MSFDINTIIPYIADAACVLLLVLFIVHYAKKGLYNCLMPFIVIILSLAFAIYGSDLLTKPVTDNYVFPRVEQQVRDKFDEAVEEGGGAEALENSGTLSLDGGSLSEIVEKVKEFAEKAGIDASKLDIESLLKSGESSGVQSAKDKILEGLLQQSYEAASTVVRWVLFGVLAVLGLIIFNLLKKLVGLMTHLPIISFFNGLGGVVIGIAVFTVLIFIASRLLRRLGIDHLDRWSQGTYILSRFMSL